MVSITEFSLPTETRLKAKRDALDKASNVLAGPANAAVNAQQTGQIFGQARSDIANIAEKGGYDSFQAKQKKLGEASKKLAESQTQQGLAQTKENLVGAAQEEDLIYKRQTEEVQRYARGQERAQYDASEAVARQAFDQGIDTKELLMHNDALVADAALERMKTDFQEGRVNDQEMLEITRFLQTSAQELKNKFDTEMAQLQADLQKAMTDEDLQRLQARQDRAMAYFEEGLKDQAKASGIASVVEGVGSVVSVFNPVLGGAITAGAGIYSAATAK